MLNSYQSHNNLMTRSFVSCTDREWSSGDEPVTHICSCSRSSCASASQFGPTPTAQSAVLSRQLWKPTVSRQDGEHSGLRLSILTAVLCLCCFDIETAAFTGCSCFTHLLQVFLCFSFLADVINIFVITMDYVTLCSVKAVDGDETAHHDHLPLQLHSAQLYQA